AAHDDELLVKAARDPKGFLGERGIDAPPDTEISLYQTFPTPAECPPGYLKVCRPGPPTKVCVVGFTIHVPPTRHTNGFDVHFCVRSVEVSDFDCVCVPIKDLQTHRPVF